MKAKVEISDYNEMQMNLLDFIKDELKKLDIKEDINNLDFYSREDNINDKLKESISDVLRDSG